MQFSDYVTLALARLQREGRITYRALQRDYGVDLAFLEDLRHALLFTLMVVDEDGQGLVWTGGVQAPLLPSVGSRATPASAEISPLPPIALARETLASPDDASTSSVPTARPDRVETDTPTDAERRQLTVMFCDLADSTRLSQQLDPEDLREVMRAYHETASQVIRRFEGYIAQYLGDGLLVYFGWPRAHEDDAPRAVHAGLGIVEAITTNLNPRLEQEKGVQLTLRIGIHTGPVVVGQMGGGDRHENLALGDTINIASRLEGLAVPSTVVISQVTARLVQDAFVLDHLGLHELKGVAEPMPVFRVLEPYDIDLHLEERPPAVFLVGRDEEIGLLQRRWEQSKEGLGQVVLVSGEAGIGKSSLIETLRARVRDEGLTRAAFRCSPYHCNSALYPVITHLEHLLRFDRDDRPETRLSKLEQGLQNRRQPLEEVVPLLAVLLSVPVPEDRYAPLTMSSQQQRQRTHDALVAWLLDEAERQPVLVVWEDLHWADPSTLDLLGLVIDQTPTVPMLHVLTFRPDFTPPWTGRSHLIPISLNRLERIQVEALVNHLAGGKTLPLEVVEHIVTKTDGVPLFVEELTKMLLESDLLREDADHYELTGPVSAVAIPATLQDSLMARLDQLNTAKEIAQLGAVLGRTFSYEMLQALSPLDEAALQTCLTQLVSAELLYQRGRPPRSRYLFKHALIQDAAYASLLRSTRQQLHQQIARLLEERFPETAETQPDLLAHHYTEAGLHEPAVLYWQRAGQRASERSAHIEAINHLTKGLHVLTTLPAAPEHAQQELTLQVALGASLTVTKGWGAPEVGQTYTRARELCQQVEDSRQLFPALRGLANYYVLKGEILTGRVLKEQLLRLAQRHQDQEELLVAHRELSQSSFWLGDVALAHTHAEKGLVLYDPERHRPLAFVHGFDFGSALLIQDACVLWFLGFPDQAVQQSHEAFALIEELHHPFSLGRALVFAGFLHRFRREGQIAQERAEAAIALSMEQGFAWWLALGTTLRGWALAEQGQMEEGITQISEGLHACRATGGVNTTTLSLVALAEAYGRGGQIEAGLHVLAETLAVVDQTAERIWEAEAHRLKGELLLQQDIPDAHQTETCFHQALTIARNQQAKSLELRAATSLARLWQSQDKCQEAYDLLAPVYNWFSEGFDTADLQEAKALLHELE